MKIRSGGAKTGRTQTKVPNYGNRPKALKVDSKPKAKTKKVDLAPHLKKAIDKAPKDPLEKELAPLQKDSTGIVSRAHKLEVVDASSCDQAGRLLVEIKGLVKVAEEKRKYLLEPLKEATNRINGEFNKLKSPLNDAANILESNIRGYRDQERIRAEAERLKLEEKAEKERVKAEEMKEEGREKAASNAEERAEKAAHEAAMVVLPASTVAEGLHVRKIWTFDVVDEMKVPREYLEINGKAVRAAITGGTREIPGLRIYQDESFAVR